MESNFNFNNLPVRVIFENDQQSWFVAIDICQILGYQNPNNIIKKLLDEDERKLEDLPDPSGQKRKTWKINESGLYSLILSSTKPEAKVFKRWITHEVLPQLRKAGIYTTDQVQIKESKLQELRKLIDRKKNVVKGNKSVIKDLENEIQKLETEFWQVFNTDCRQLQLYPQEVMESLKS